MAGAGWDHWTSPPEIPERIERGIGRIGLDPCSNKASVVPARATLDGKRGRCGLAADWFAFCDPAYPVVYANVPFSDLEAWRHKAATTARPTWTPWHVVLLSPDNGDTESYRHLLSANVVAKLGRVKFNNAPPGKSNDRPRFGTCLAYWGTDPSAFVASFADIATFWRPIVVAAA